MITEDYVSFETAKLLKKKGFDCGCACINHPQCGMSLIGHMINNTGLQLTREYELCIDKENLFTVPTIQMAMKWLREVHNINLNIDWNPSFKDYFVEIFKPTLLYSTTTYQNYEDACEAGIKYCIENLI